jgi:hypothetical protein
VLTRVPITASSAAARSCVGVILGLALTTSAHAQQPPPTGGPSPAAPAGLSPTPPAASASPPSDHRGHDATAHEARHDDPKARPHEEGQAGEAHEHRDDRHHAEQGLQELHETIRKKLVAYDATLRKQMVDKQQEEQRRRQESRRAQAVAASPPGAAGSDPSSDGGPKGSAAGPAEVTKPIPFGDARNRPSRVAGPSPMPAAVRAVSTDAPKNPHGAHPLLTPIGGAAPYDPKKSATLAGTAVHHRP